MVRLSSRYEIDYSILTQTLTDEQKMSCINILIRCGFSLKISVGQRSLGYFTVAAQSVFKRIETRQNSETGKEVHGEKGPIVIYKVMVRVKLRSKRR